MASVCPCGGLIEQSIGRGRPRKFCLTCRPRNLRRNYTPVARTSTPCSVCGEPTSSRRMYCSDACKWVARPRIPCSRCGEPTGYARGATDGPVAHDRCRSRPDHGTPTRYGYGCRCEVCRAAQTEVMADYRRRYRERTGQSYYDRYRRRDPGGRGGHFVSRAERFAIYDRDGWICQLCSDPVDPDLKSPHRLSATLDHIEPVSYALIPDHSPGNLRLAHRTCNSSRGNREGGRNDPKSKPGRGRRVDPRTATQVSLAGRA